MRLNLSSSRQLAAMVALLVVGVVDVVQAAPPVTVAEQRLNQVLRHHVTIRWQGQQLGEAVARLAASQQLVVWLDRRVDPEQRVNLQLRDVRVDAALTALAAEFDLGIAQLGGIVYLGPQQAARELPMLAEHARAALAGATTRRRWLRTAPSDWPRLSEPRALLAAMLANNDLELLDGERVPHDLWAARQLPAMALVDRVVLLLIGFDLTCQTTSSGDCRVVSIRRPVAAKAQRGGSTENVGRRESAPTNNLERVFSLRLQRQAVGPVVEQLAAQLELEIVWDESLDPAVRDTRVSCDVQNVQFDELLERVLRPAGLRAEQKENRVVIRVAE